jgi:hypothetical protein
MVGSLLSVILRRRNCRLDSPADDKRRNKVRMKLTAVPQLVIVAVLGVVRLPVSHDRPPFLSFLFLFFYLGGVNCFYYFEFNCKFFVVVVWKLYKKIRLVYTLSRAKKKEKTKQTNTKNLCVPNQTPLARQKDRTRFSVLCFEGPFECESLELVVAGCCIGVSLWFYWLIGDLGDR